MNINYKLMTAQCRCTIFSISLIFISCHTSSRIQKGPPDLWNASNPVSCSGMDCAAVGSYNLDGITAGARPLAAFSTDNGKLLTTSTQFSLLPEMSSTQSIQLFGIDCTNDHCVGVGFYNYNISPNSGLPLSVTSLDGGKTFFANTSQPLLPLGSNSSAIAQLSGVTCNGQTCVAVGIYNLVITMGAAGGLPLVVTSSDGGITFTGTPQVSLPTDTDDTGTLNTFLSGISCVNQRCTAIGNYNVDLSMGSKSLPLIVNSNDNGQTFSTSFKPTLPTDAAVPDLSKLRSIACNSKQCVVVGYYALPSGVLAPLVLVSHDGGQSFPISYKPNLPADADNTLSAQLAGISCYEEECIAVGNYNVTFDPMGNGATSGYPLILVSHDSGDSFTVAYQPPLPADSISTPNALLTGVNCILKTCMAVGGYNLGYTFTNPSGGLPYSLYSNDSGNSFILTPSIILPVGADAAKGAAFGQLSQR